MSLPKRIETLITSFTGGITNDPRDERKGMIRMVSNFDILTDAKRIIPYRDTESGDSSASTSQKQNFAIALRTGSTYSLYSLGVKSGAATAEVLYKDLTTGGSADLGDALWSAPSNNQSSAGTGSLDLFTYYKKTGLIYGARAGTHVWAFSPSGSAWADTHQALTYTEVSEGLVHSKDDILYIPYFNAGGLIAKNDNGSWSVTALTLPTYLNPTSICEYGNYLAIGCEPISGIGRSVVFLWDRDSSLATVSEKIDWGEGKLKVLEVIDGVLVGISVNGADQSRINHRITFKYYDGQGAVKFNELLSTTSPILLKRKQKHDGRLFFMLRGTFSGAVREGVWSIGRALVGSPLAISHEQTPNNDTALTDNGVLKGFFKVGDYMFISYVNESSVFSLSKTNDSSSFTATAIIETIVFNGGDSSKKKKLVGVSVMTEKLPTAGQIVLKHRVDGATSWTTTMTEATDSSISKSVVTDLPKAYKELEFRVESTGGAVPTGLTFEEDVIGARNY